MRRVFLLCGMLLCMPANLLAFKHPINSDRIKDNVDGLTHIGSRFTVTDMYNFEITKASAQLQKVEFIESELKSYGYKTKREYFYASNKSSLPDALGINIVASKEGSSNKTIELGAHYDTAGVAGADDNISGTVGVLEAARILASIKTKANINFILYDLEEIGLEGSKHHVKQLKKNKTKISGAYVFEMIGFKKETKGSQTYPVTIPIIFDPPKVGDFIAVLGNFKSAGLGRDFIKTAKENQLKTYDAKRIAGFFRDSARSDHKPYWDASIPAIMITDTANFRNPHYHEHSDTFETLDFNFLAQVVDSMIETLIKF